jgi:Tfp pilus assembly protein PilF
VGTNLRAINFAAIAFRSRSYENAGPVSARRGKRTTEMHTLLTAQIVSVIM